MRASNPHYWLYSEAGEAAGLGHWRFILRSADGAERLEADETERDVRGERLELLAVVRGLEALDQPSRVTLVTTSSYVREGIRRGVLEWQRNGWCWEFFGHMVPVKHQDLWKRVERALAFHNVDCRSFRVDAPHCVAAAVAPPQPHFPRTASLEVAQSRVPSVVQAMQQHARGLRERWQQARQWCAGMWRALAPALRLG